MAALTPMMRQYLEIKAQYPDSILFFRLGDFYEMFDDDARTASAALDLTLTTRDKDPNKTLEEKTPMCGIPYHASDAYIARLIAKGHKVAICEQMEDPATTKGIVRRDIIRVVTPGTVMDSACLEEKKSRFLCSVYVGNETAGVSFCDLSTGQIHATAFAGKECVSHLESELGRFDPAEAVVNQGAVDVGVPCMLQEKLSCSVEQQPEPYFDLTKGEAALLSQFGQAGIANVPRENPAAIQSLGGLLRYLHQTQKTQLSHINQLDFYSQSRFMELDLSARRSLELTETLRNREKKGSLLWVIDRTKTPMGGRLLRAWLEQPLRNVTAIAKRAQAVEDLVGQTLYREELVAALTGLGDMERQMGRIVYGNAGGKDLVALRTAIEKLPAIVAQLAPFSTGRLGVLRQELDLLSDVASDIAQTLVDEPPFSIREGGMVRKGCNEEVDRLNDLLTGGKGILADMEAREKEKYNIRTLKISYNKVFGYYIEVSKLFSDKVPDTYIRKQTTANAERYITEELKELEHTILTAKDRVAALEGELFEALRQRVTLQVRRVQDTAAAVAELDVYGSLATVAVRNQYCRPSVDESGIIEIHQGRHGVVEKVLKDSLFVPNDTYMGEKSHRCAVITGPNMAGKSTYMRQVAHIVLLAQMGSFVPASSARIGVVDRIFTRIGASDDLTAGQSTFMVEMTEVSDILHQATPNSLLILDEIGRGTSTYDGMSIARAVVEFCADPKRLGAKTLFATHYHELTDLEHALPGVSNYSIAVKTRGDDIVFLRKIIPGGADRSYGIEVAKLAGLPKAVVRRAKEVLQELESASNTPRLQAPEEDQMGLGQLQEATVLEQLRRCQVDMLSPMEALNLLYEWKQNLQ